MKLLESGMMGRSEYWGHYPIVDVEYTASDSPVEVGVRSWSPFIPGDVAPCIWHWIPSGSY